MEPNSADEIFPSSVIYIKSLIGKTVSLKTCDNNEHTGIVYVIDPVYKTVVLVPEINGNELIFVLYNAIRAFTVLDDAPHEPFLQKPSTPPSENPKEVTENKERLMKWLNHMFINVEDNGQYLTVQDHVRIEAPYTQHNCICDNTIVLEKIRKIMDLMPQDFQ